MATRIPIPDVRQQQRIGGMPSARTSMVTVEDLTGRVVAGLGSTVGQIGDAVQRHQREQSIAWVSKASSDDQIKWLTRMNELQDSAEPGAPNFTPNLLTEFDQYADEAVRNAPPEAQAFYRESLTRQRTYLGQHAVTFEATRQREHTVAQYQGGLESDAAAIALDPSLYSERRASRVAALNSSALPAAVKSKLLVDSEAALAFAAGAAAIDRDPRGVMQGFQTLADGQPVPGMEWMRHLDSDRIQQLRTRATTQTDRIETRTRIEQDRAIARGQRAIGEIDKQISTGVPARQEDLLRWAGMVAGTDYEQPFRDLLRGQDEVQKVLRMPIPDQQAYVANRQRELRTAGGNTTDIANLSRVSSAIEANTKMLSEAPLSWIEARTGQALNTLDVSTLATPDGTATFGQSLRARADDIRALQRTNPAGMVNMRPLLESEAQQLSEVFKQGGPREKRQILGALYWAAGEPDLYQGLVDQVDGLDPFMARVGRLAGSFESAKLVNNWLSPDVVQSAGDAAALAIAGDEILRNGGKAGNISYPVPKDADFVQAIQEHVGDLYRGINAGDSAASEFMQDAYAVKAYYVGKAAQEGDLQADVNDERLTQAITAVLGQPVDLHGNGRVLAPWGMNESDFSTRANQAIAREVAARGMQENLGRSMGNVGLFGIGVGAYAMTLGGTPVLDPKTGEPVIITMTPGADQGRDTFGRRLSDQIPDTAP